MDGIIRLKHINDYRRVCYYSVCIHQDEDSIDEAESIFESFVLEHQEKEHEKLNHILAWVKEIGDKYGAIEGFFRPEQNQGEALGLPPKNYEREPVYVEDGDAVPNNLRLYCHRLNENVVFLFSGGLKTANTPQECPNVKPHFELANKLTKVLDDAFKNHDINWNQEFTDIDYPDDLIINL